jgi:CMP/dCMP kinase
MTTSIVIAVDGPSGSGKSSAARGVAHRLGLRYLDTGAMYRAVTWWMLQHDVDVEDRDAVAAVVAKPQLEVTATPTAPAISVDGVDVTEAIRTPGVTSAVSAVAAVPAVRARLIDRQREIIGAGGIVVEGRDIGSVVVPGAKLKIYLTADEAARAGRRAAELSHDLAATQADLARRDTYDSTRGSLIKAADAYELDTTAHSLDEVIEIILSLVRDRTGVG